MVPHLGCAQTDAHSLCADRLCLRLAVVMRRPPCKRLALYYMVVDIVGSVLRTDAYIANVGVDVMCMVDDMVDVVVIVGRMVDRWSMLCSMLLAWSTLWSTAFRFVGVLGTSVSGPDGRVMADVVHMVGYMVDAVLSVTGMVDAWPMSWLMLFAWSTAWSTEWLIARSTLVPAICKKALHDQNCLSRGARPKITVILQRAFRQPPRPPAASRLLFPFRPRPSSLL